MTSKEESVSTAASAKHIAPRTCGNCGKLEFCPIHTTTKSDLLLAEFKEMCRNCRAPRCVFELFSNEHMQALMWINRLRCVPYGNTEQEELRNIYMENLMQDLNYSNKLSEPFLKCPPRNNLKAFESSKTGENSVCFINAQVKKAQKSISEIALQEMGNELIDDVSFTLFLSKETETEDELPTTSSKISKNETANKSTSVCFPNDDIPWKAIKNRMKSGLQRQIKSDYKVEDHPIYRKASSLLNEITKELKCKSKPGQNTYLEYHLDQYVKSMSDNRKFQNMMKGTDNAHLHKFVMMQMRDDLLNLFILK